MKHSLRTVKEHHNKRNHQAARLGKNPNKDASADSNAQDSFIPKGWNFDPNFPAPRLKIGTILEARKLENQVDEVVPNSNDCGFSGSNYLHPLREIDGHQQGSSLIDVRNSNEPKQESSSSASAAGALVSKPETVALTNTHLHNRLGIVAESAKSDDFIRLNVGGQRFMLRKDTIKHRGVGRLLSLINAEQNGRMKFVDGYFSSTNEYYLERSPALFNVVYQFYMNGQIHQPSHLCPIDILDELAYWGCDDDEDSDSQDDETPNLFKHLYMGELRKEIWNIVEEPASSRKAQIFATLSVLFVLISILGLILGSIPEFQIPVKKPNSTEVIDNEPHPALTYMEYGCIVWFTIEYGLKMSVSPHRKRTFLQLLNVIDLMAIVPFFVEMFLFLIGINTEQLRDLKGAFLVIRILRVLRVIRVLKLGRYSSGLQMFGKTLKASFRSLTMMACVVATGVIFFSTLVYFLEKDEPGSQFYSIPAACWWCIVTMTTVDLTPITVPGKLVATGAIACGVLVLALPITIITTSNATHIDVASFECQTAINRVD
ncbi:hypothetical protein WR25_03407 isoform A [Diploscapter pachys]|uniref:BTB domain-containing protein n=1 Tax=Diploscapter pachys TaxID=2018661 RepID=A0A2A2LTB4_9BILA|nr:hypothetical protein WR25_03407 isoform A [Diploscapter pachys]